MALILILIVGIIMLLVQYSVVITKLTEQNKNIIQENALLNYEVEKLKEKINKIEETNNK